MNHPSAFFRFFGSGDGGDGGSGGGGGSDEVAVIVVMVMVKRQQRFICTHNVRIKPPVLLIPGKLSTTELYHSPHIVLCNSILHPLWPSYSLINLVVTACAPLQLTTISKQQI